MTPTATTTKPLRVIGYVRVSTNKQEVGPEVQIDALQGMADLLGTWDLDLRREDAVSAKSLYGRPVLAKALEDLRRGRADMLAVSKLVPRQATFARLMMAARLMTLRSCGSVAWVLRQMM